MQQGRIHGNPVADGWAGAVMRKPIGIQKRDSPTYRPTDLPTDTASFRVACPRLKRQAPVFIYPVLAPIVWLLPEKRQRRFPSASRHSLGSPFYGYSVVPLTMIVEVL